MSADNPPAFPVSTIDGYTNTGLTLRDWFAGQALSFALELNRDWLKANPKANYPYHEAVAKDAYEIADAMLSERMKGVDQ